MDNMKLKGLRKSSGLSFKKIKEVQWTYVERDKCLVVKSIVHFYFHFYFHFNFLIRN